MHMPCQAAKTSVMSPQNITKVVWYILVQLSSLSNTMSMVSGVSVQVSGKYRGQPATSSAESKTKGRLFLFSDFCHLLSDT